MDSIHADALRKSSAGSELRPLGINTSEMIMQSGRADGTLVHYRLMHGA